MYAWQRYWYPRGQPVALIDGGYLPDPEQHRAYIDHGLLVPFSVICTHPCLVLLGEPGIGKSTAMAQEQATIDAAITGTGAEVMHLDLRSYGSESSLMRDLFDDSGFRAWVAGTHELYLYLDSLDEGLLHIRTIATLLARELRKCPINRLRLRIACRTAEWPHSLEADVTQLWGEDDIAAYELAPLRRADVSIAAAMRSLDAATFLDAVNRAGVVPLAIKPVTLEFLLNVYVETGGCLPQTQAELYRQGCLLLCEETNEGRRDAGLVGTLDAQQRLAVAERVAAATVFGNLYAVWTAPDKGDVPGEDITIARLCGTEVVDGTAMRVDEAAIKESLTTGLFSSCGPHRMGWAHQTYAEALAAEYFVAHRMPRDQIMALLVHPDDPEGRIAPQLQETAARLASLVPDIFRDILTREPEILLRSDVMTASDADRAALVSALLTLPDEMRIQRIDDASVQWYGKLAHADLAAQLRPHVRGASGNSAQRRMAIHIAHACALRDLQDDLVAVALDADQPHPLRVVSAIVISGIGSSQTKARLMPLAVDGIGVDPNDDLKGASLRALWPGHMTARDLFDALTPPQNERVLGLYRAFLYALPGSIPIAELPLALDWCAQWLAAGRGCWEFERLMAALLLRGWEHLSYPGVVATFARTILAQVALEESHASAHSNQAIREGLRSNTEKRQQVLLALLPLLATQPVDDALLVRIHMPVVLTQDVPWLVSQLRSTAQQDVKRVLVKLIVATSSIWDPVQHEVIYEACLDEALLAEAFGWMMKGIALDSSDATTAKEYYVNEQRWRVRQEAPPIVNPPPAERIVRLLDRFEAGDTAAWWRLNMEMTLGLTSTHYDNELEADLTALPGWQAADGVTKVRIVEAAKRYLQTGDPETDTWLGTNVIHRPAFAGYRALQILLLEAPDALELLPASVWQAWAGIILAYPTGSDHDRGRADLVKRAYAATPSAIIGYVEKLIDSEGTVYDHALILRMVKQCWDNRLATSLLGKMRDPMLKPGYLGEILAELLDHQSSDARVFAESLITIPPPEGSDACERAIVAAYALLTHADDAGWAIVWPTMQQASAFGRAVVEDVAYRANFGVHRVSVAQVLPESELADLYAWLIGHYPYAEDPVVDGYIGPRHSIAQWRDGILAQLVERATPAACAALRRLADTMPQIDTLKWVLLRAEDAMRLNTWRPPTPEHIMALAANTDKRLVRNGEQLLDVLVEALREVERTLHDETPAAIDVWNAPRKGKKTIYTPRDENTFSDYVTRRLRELLRGRGTVLNREVEFRRGHGAKGQRTDIKVEAVLRDSDNGEIHMITAIVEVKGCWHEDLDHAMETQLVDQYLKESACEHGLYLVGWFNCTQWDPADSRKAKVPKHTKEEAQRRFNAQVAGLSAGSVSVRAVVMDTALRDVQGE